MAEPIRYGYITVDGHKHEVSWHTISGNVFVYSKNWWRAGRASSLDDALDQALSYMRSKGWS